MPRDKTDTHNKLLPCIKQEFLEHELHILCTTFVTALCETIKHEYTREQALKHLDFIGKMLYPGMKEVLGF